MLDGVRPFRIPSLGKVEVDQTTGEEVHYPAHGNLGRFSELATHDTDRVMVAASHPVSFVVVIGELPKECVT